MKKIQAIAFASCSALLLCQCASVDDVRRLNYQLRTMNQKVKEVEANTTNQVLKRTAESSTQLDNVAEETREFRTITEENLEAISRKREQDAQKIDELEEALQQLRRENQQIRSESDQVRSESVHVRRENEQLIQTLESKINKLSSNIQRLSQSRVYAAEKKARQAAERAEQAKRRAVLATQDRQSENTILLPSNRKVRKNYGAVVDSAPPPQTQLRINQPIVNASSRPTIMPQKQKEIVTRRQPRQQVQQVQEVPVQQQASVMEHPPQRQQLDMRESLLEQGISQFKAKDYKSAYKVFEQVLAGHPADDQAAKTLYFMGECLFNLGEYDLAILDYQKVISNYRRNPHSSAALLRQGMSFEKLTDHETAKIIYTKLTADYPNSREAGVARQRLESL
ncbi:MAG: tetratricopeptide repeat protein [Candidatus Electrothrix sp. GW3-4]|uniref:tetratricopeptide repeat protein n=1 Tax=Candidatus Electrothrix sp. GW3-4 TaxID=3126740 RepID=UPI0030D479FB